MRLRYASAGSVGFNRAAGFSLRGHRRASGSIARRAGDSPRTGCFMTTPPLHRSETPALGVRRKGLVDALLSLQCKATILVAGVTLAVTAASAGYLLRTSAGLFREQRNEELEQLGAMLARAAAVTLGTGDHATLQTLAEEAADGRPLQYVMISGVDGNQLASAQYQDAPHPIPSLIQTADGAVVPGRSFLWTEPGGKVPYLNVSFPISLRSVDPSIASSSEVRLVGHLRAGMVADGWHHAVSSQLDLLVGVGMVIILSAIPLGFLVIRRIMAPLDRLASAMDRFSQGELGVRAPGGRRDEIGRLETAFNRMADQQQQTHERLVRLNAELERRVAERTRQLRELAVREPLTSLYNRRHFNEMLDRCLSEAARYDNDLSCIMIDLDDFKAVNDDFGHRVGDEVLVLAAETIQGALRLSDVPARFGGDEFIILLPQTDESQARALGARIVTAFAQRLSETLPKARTRMSVGIASVAALPSADAESLVRAADRALYQAKDAVRDTLAAAPGSSI